MTFRPKKAKAPVAEAVAEIGQVRFGAVEPLVDGEVVLYLATPLAHRTLGMVERVHQTSYSS